MSFFKKAWPFVVTLNCKGRHPYLTSHELDYFEGEKTVDINVTAKTWADAEIIALRVGPQIQCWGWSCEAIRRGPVTPIQPRDHSHAG